MSEKQLPKGWKMESFASVFDISGGTQPPKSNFIYEPKQGYIRLLQIRDFGEKPVPTFIPQKKTLKTCKEEDVLIARYGASIGRILTGMNGAYNVAIAKVIIPENINNKYVFWLLNSRLFQSKITSFQRTAQNGFNKNDLEEIHLPIAPPAEQQSIVAKLDMVFGHLEVLREKLDRIPILLKNFRQQVLTQAVTGELTKEWREGKDLGEWENSTLKSLTDIDVGQAFKSAEFESEGVRLLRGQNIEPGSLRWNDTVYFPESKLGRFNHLYIKEGEVILAMDRPIISSGLKVALAKKEDLPCVLVQRVARFRPSKDLDSKFLFYLISSDSYIYHLFGEQTGTQIPHISGKQILSFEFLSPTIEEQQEIVKRIDALFGLADKIESQFQSLKAKIDQLPQAVLEKAFRGELVGQDPSEERSSVLLKRIPKEKVERDED